MLTQDLITIGWWWFVLFTFGVFFLPTTYLFFQDSFDSGYAFSKTVAYLLLSYFVWLLGSLKILPFTNLALYLLLFIFFVSNGFIFLQKRYEIKNMLKEKFSLILFEEVLFFSTLTCWSLVRGFLPDIRGLEKFMDYGFMNSVLASTYFPPVDMWFSSQHINYYYFGHLISAVITKTTAVLPGASYNLMIATLFALTFVSSFSIAGNLVYKKSLSSKWSFLAGIIAALLVTLGGNFHTLFIAFKNITAGASSLFLNYWYPDATRFIVQQYGARDNTIHEFPIYSFVVADLHGHLINLPSVLLFLGLLVQIIISKRLSKQSLIAVSFLLGVFYMTNAWDLPVYGAIFGFVTFYVFWKKTRFNIKTILLPAIIGAGVLAGSFVVTLPFNLVFKNISNGIALSSYQSPLWMLFVLWGGPFLVSLLFCVFLLTQKGNRKSLEDTDVFVLILLFVSWLLVAVPEFVYVKDIYIDSYQRANTMFKFTYQSFVMFSLSSGYILVRIVVSKLEKLKFIYQKFLVFLPVTIYCTSLLIYPYFAISSFYSLKTYKSLNGEFWLFKEYPGEYRALEWLRENATRRSVVLTAPGDSYSDYGVINAYSGMPTIQGWFVHEWLWRGSPDEPNKRVAEVETIYTSESLELTRDLLKKYEVEYLVVGRLERDKYINLRSSKFLSLGQLVFSSDGTQVYRVQ